MMENTVTEKRIKKVITNEEYMKMGNKTTVCLLTLENGFEVVGSSACVDPNNFDEAVGRKWARKMAIDRIERFEGYMLQSELTKMKRGGN